MNKGYFVPVTLIGLLLVLAGIVLFVPFTQTNTIDQNIPLNQNPIENNLNTEEVIENEELPPITTDNTQEENPDENEETTDTTSPQIPAGMPTPECAQDPNCANQLGCTTDPETGMTICF